jgi:yeast amino acid transporter
MAEMVTYLPISSPFIRFASRWVDEAFGVAAGYNFFIFEAALVPFEVTACNFVINFWSSAVPVGGIIAIVLVLYALVFYTVPSTPKATPPSRLHLLQGLSISLR